MRDEWTLLEERHRGRRYVTWLELLWIVRPAMITHTEAIDADLAAGDPDKELVYAGTALVMFHFARHGWNPPPVVPWTVN